MKPETIQMLLNLAQTLGTPENIAYVKSQLEIDEKDKKGNEKIDKVVSGDVKVEDALPFFEQRFKGRDPISLIVEYKNKRPIEQLALMVCLIEQTPGYKALNYKPQFKWGDREHYNAFLELKDTIFVNGRGEDRKYTIWNEFVMSLPSVDEETGNVVDF
jgi:hypothetical protein